MGYDKFEIKTSVGGEKTALILLLALSVCMIFSILIIVVIITRLPTVPTAVRALELSNLCPTIALTPA